MMKFSGNGLALILCTLALAGPVSGEAQTAVPQPAVAPAARPAAPTSARVLQLVAPIALYPDPLVAQILAAATNPGEVAQASDWMQLNPLLTGADLAAQVDAQIWDASIKALTQFPSVLQNMDSNLQWTAALGQSYLGNQQGVLSAIQVLRHRAYAAGKLRNTSEQTVTVQGPTIAIAPADPDFVYLPAYDPWRVYGAPIVAYPGWVDVPGTYDPGADLYFGDALGIGLFAGLGLGWGWNDWGFDWHAGRMIHGHEHQFAAGGMGHHDHDPGLVRGEPHGHEAAFADAGNHFDAHEHPGYGGLLGRPEEHASIGGGLHAEAGMGGGFHSEGEHAFGEHIGSEHAFGEHIGGEHAFGGHMGGGFEGGGHMGGFGGGHMGGGFGGGGHGGGGHGGGGHGGGGGGGHR